MKIMSNKWKPMSFPPPEGAEVVFFSKHKNDKWLSVTLVFGEAGYDNEGRLHAWNNDYTGEGNQYYEAKDFTHWAFPYDVIIHPDSEVKE
jgi:hypothetical protein